MRLNWIDKLARLLQVMAFSLAIATVQYAFAPERPYAPPVVYSLAIGMITWAVIDLGRHLFPSSHETGWPQGVGRVGLVVGGILAGYLLGNTLGDLACRTFDLYGGAPPRDRATDLRNSILITVMAGIVGSYYFYSRGKSEYLERKMGEARRHASEARLKLLETQLEPHMLFNTLANLRVLIGTDAARAQTMLDHMIAYLRATLAASRTSTHPLRAEFDRLRDYLELMSVRMGPRLAYTLDLPDALAGEPVPALLLQPLVENAIKHGLEPKVAGGHVTVTARRDGADVVLEVADTGVGMADGAAAADTAGTGGTHFGLAQVRERLQTAYGAASAIDLVAGQAGGVRVTARFPSQA